MPATTRKNTPRLRDGVMKRGTTWSYVIRVKDSETGVSKPRWVGGFATEDDAKAARDEARVKARHGEYIDRNRITVAATRSTLSNAIVRIIASTWSRLSESNR